VNGTVENYDLLPINWFHDSVHIGTVQSEASPSSSRHHAIKTNSSESDYQPSPIYFLETDGFASLFSCRVVIKKIPPMPRRISRREWMREMQSGKGMIQGAEEPARGHLLQGQEGRSSSFEAGIPGRQSELPNEDEFARTLVTQAVMAERVVGEGDIEGREIVHVDSNPLRGR
jgi:hypothetical protein